MKTKTTIIRITDYLKIHINKIRSYRLSLPHWTFLAVVLLTFVVLLFPPDLRQVYSPNRLPPGVPTEPAIFPYPVGLPNASASCAPKCQYQVCTDWVPGPSPQCPNPGSGGGCCLSYATKCQPGCNADQPPSISGTVTCGQSGSNGWCRSNAQLVLSASDPQGYSVTISGDLNGAPFSCGSSCTLTLPTGTGTANYTATSSTSNMTASGSTTWKYDPDPPTASLSVTSGTFGSNGWYQTPVTVTATTADAISGVASVSMSDNGSSPVAGSSITLNTDGKHTVSLTVIDNAGNSTTVSSSVKIDQTPPAITFTPTGTTGNNGWYVSSVNVTISITDPASGVQSSQYSVDGGSSVNNAAGAVIPLSDGSHTISASAVDNAGNDSTQSITLKIDTVPPALSVSLLPATPNGANNWYRSLVSLSATSSDSGSGVASTEYLVDGGAWQTGTNVTVSNDGAHTVDFRTTDMAGNTTAESQSFQIDATSPISQFSSPAASSVQTGTVQITGISTDATSGLSAAQISFDNINWTPLTLTSGTWSYNWDTSSLPNAPITIYARATDTAGNIETPIQLPLMLDNHPPKMSLTATWKIWDSGTLTVTPDLYALKRVSVDIKDPQHRWPNQPVSPNLSENLPTTDVVTGNIKWDRKFGAIYAPSGDYLVLVTACDVNNVCKEVSGTITVPPPFINIFGIIPTATLAPTMTPTALPTIAPTPTGTQAAPQATPTRGEVFVPPAPPSPPATPSESSLQATGGISSGSVQVGGWVIGIMLSLALAGILDTRPNAVRKLTASIGKAIERNKKSQ